MARIFFERHDGGDEARRMIQIVDDRLVPHGGGDYAPPIDVIETALAIEVILDIPGVDSGSVSVAFARNVLVITGRKVPTACQHHAAAFHLAERTFGHFARGVRLTGAFDAGAARATLSAGELRIVLPRIEERRGAEIRIPIQAD